MECVTDSNKTRATHYVGGTLLKVSMRNFGDTAGDIHELEVPNIMYMIQDCIYEDVITKQDKYFDSTK